MKSLRIFSISLLMLSSGCPALAASRPITPKTQDAYQSPVAVNAVPTFASKLPQPNPVSFSRSGSAVAVSLDTAAVGAPGFSESQTGQGTVYIYSVQNGVWSLRQTLLPPDPQANSQFGCSVSIYRDTLVVGSSRNTTTQVGQGAAYIYSRVNGAWVFQAKLLPRDTQANDFFGTSVSIFGNVAVIGAPGKGITGVNQGAAYVFTQAGGTWSETIQIKANDGAANDRFGTAVAISDRLVAVGAPGNDNLGIDQGGGYIFENRDGIGWGQVAKLLATDGNANHNLGTSIAINGRTALAGAPGVSGTSGSNQGAAYVFNDRGGNSWGQTTKFSPPDPTTNGRFGASVALAGRNALVGAPGAVVNGTPNGAIYLHQRGGLTWTYRQRLTAPDGVNADSFGSAVSLNGGTAFVGSPNVSESFNTSSGAAYVFKGFSKNASTPGQFRPTNGFAYLRNSNDTGFANTEFFYGIANDIPVSGDWNGDGIDTIGIFRAGTFFLRNSNSTGNADLQVTFGGAGDLPVAGDWDGDGIDTIGVFRSGAFLLRNSNTNGFPNLSFVYGTIGDIPVAGDWDGDGIDTVGAFRPSTGFVFLRNSNTTGDPDINFFYGTAGDKPVAGDWNGDGIDTIGIVRGNQWLLRNTNTTGFADFGFFYGTSNDTPITGDWDGQ
jgi:hypothetical protein